MKLTVQQRLLGASLALALPLALPLAARAQGGNKSYVGVQAGVSVPTSKFSKADYGDNQAGFAKTGFHVAVDGAHYFGGGLLGLAGQLAFSDNGGLTKADLQKIGNGFTDGFGVDQSTISGDGRYRRLTGMVGPAVMIGGDKLKLEIRALAGVVKSLGTPEVTVQLEDNTDTPLVQHSSTSTVFGYQAGLGVHYAFTDRIGLVLRGDYLKAGDLTIGNDNRLNNAGRYNEKQPLTALNTSLGLTFHFGQ